MILNHKIYGAGKPLIILHGLFGSLDNWASMAKQLSEYFMVICMDLRNHGNSPHDDEWNYDVMASDVKETMQTLGIEKTNIAGHSMGGKTAISFAELFPESIQKLMVIDIAPRYYEPHHQEILTALFSIDFQKVTTRKEAEKKLSESIKDLATRQFLLKNLFWKNSSALAWRFNLEVLANNIEIVGTKTPKTKVVIQTPTLFVKGELSNYINHKDEEEIQAIFPNSQLITVKNAGHWIHAEKPFELFECFNTFFKQ